MSRGAKNTPKILDQMNIYLLAVNKCFFKFPCSQYAPLMTTNYLFFDFFLKRAVVRQTSPYISGEICTGKVMASKRDWAFEHTQFPALYSYCTADNVASYKAAEAIGMSFLKELINKDNIRDGVSIITREDWRKLENSY